MKTILRSTSVLLVLGSGLLSSVAFGAEPANLPPVQAADTAAPASGWETSPAPTPAPTAVTPPANNAQTEMNSPASALAPSPYGTNNPAPAPAHEVKLATPPPAELKPADDGPPTLLGKAGDYAFGGFGGITVQYTRFVGQNAVQVCGEGAVIIDHALTLGGGGCGITTNPNAQKFAPDLYGPNDRVMSGYGGAIIRYHLFSHSIVNLGVGALIGAGGLSVGTLNSNSDGTDNYTHVRSQAYFVFEPEVGAYSNVTRWLRIGITGGYRIVSGVSMQGFSSGDVCAPVLGGTVQGGWF